MQRVWGRNKFDITGPGKGREPVWHNYSVEGMRLGEVRECSRHQPGRFPTDYPKHFYLYPNQDDLAREEALQISLFQDYSLAAVCR